MQENPVFHKAQDFQFQPSEYDTVRHTAPQTSAGLRINYLQLLALFKRVGWRVCQKNNNPGLSSIIIAPFYGLL